MKDNSRRKFKKGDKVLIKATVEYYDAGGNYILMLTNKRTVPQWFTTKQMIKRPIETKKCHYCEHDWFEATF